MSNPTTETTDTAAKTETVNPNPVEEVKQTAEMTDTETETTDTVAVEPEPQYACGCGYQGSVREFSVPSFTRMIEMIKEGLKAEGKSCEGRIEITPEQVPQFAACNATCRALKGALFSMEEAIEKSRARQQRSGAVAAAVGSSTSLAPLDPEAEELTSCCFGDACKSPPMKRREALIPGWWDGVQILAAGLQGSEKPQVHVSSADLLKVGAEGLVPCKEHMVPTLELILEKAKKMGLGQESMGRIKPFPLMVAVRLARKQEAKKADELAAKAKAEAEAAAEAKRVVEDHAAKKATISDLFAAKAADRHRRNNNNGGSKADRQGRKPKNGHWSNDE